MAAPAGRFREIPINTATTALDTALKRLGVISGQALRTTTTGQEVNFGQINMSAGGANSSIHTVLWDITADNGNTIVDTFMLWGTEGFDQVGSVIRFQPLSVQPDAPDPEVLTNPYAQSATIPTYTWADMPTSNPGVQNVYPSNEGSSMALSTTSDDVVIWAMYLAIAANETTGNYTGIANVGYELQFSLQFSYS